MEESSGVAVLVPHSAPQDSVFIPGAEAASAPPSSTLPGEPRPHGEAGEEEDSQSLQHRQAADSLIQVIEKLSKIVEKRPQRRCSLSGQKRALLGCASSRGAADSREGSGGASPCKKPREGDEVGVAGERTQVDPSSGSRTVTCYQCSLCRFLSPTLAQLREHLCQHNEQHSELILMCSECRFTSRHQDELERHVRLHFDGDAEESCGPRPGAEQEQVGAGGGGGIGADASKSSADCAEESPAGKKWYSHEEYGTYRCLICSYVCGQQRMLKTHAWKHAGLVDCSYPIFEDEAAAPCRREAPFSPVPVPPVTEGESLVVLAPFPENPPALRNIHNMGLCGPTVKEDTKQGSSSRPQPIGEESSAEEAYPSKDPPGEVPMVEVRVTAETTGDSCRGNTAADSLLSSAQKIISCSQNTAGHVNVIVERLPCAEEPVATKPLLLAPGVDVDESLLAGIKVEEEEENPPTQPQPLPVHKEDLSEVVIGWGCGDRQLVGVPPPAPSEPPPDENIPPARTRTHSESLRLHSLAAEALVAMPMRTPELHKPSLKTLDGGQRLLDEAPAADSSAADLRSSEGVDVLQSQARERGLGPGEGLGEDAGLGEEEEGPAKAGISVSLLTVIERLRERSDQNASDEDILRELQDNAQGRAAPGGGDGGARACGGAAESPAPDGGLVDYLPGSERPYRCRLCLYSSGNKGYVKQHLRVHRQRQPYQCPICEHVSLDSKDLETHMIHHCKSRLYECRHCPHTFHYKSQLRSHEREQHSVGDTAATLTLVTETTATIEESERTTDEDSVRVQKVYKCDVCDYTSSTYVGVRNHRRIHNSDKPYRCCSCDFATTNMNSLKSHMRRHPQEHQAVQLLEQYRCSLCGYVCSHPPSLKSHMWKHAGDQNYNYEQVNKAINEAITQSSRSPAVPQKPPIPDPMAERAILLHAGKDREKDKERVSAEPGPPATVFQVDGLEAETPGATTTLDPLQVTPREQSGDHPSHPGREGAPQARPGAGPGMEYCVLLFCCCICGFESTSKERLMEHMKVHEGDIISIILNKEHQQSTAQPVEGSTAQ
ncbi:zinc finger protein 507 [Osmerus eperlanus]|uniref:zinc finger protein 507 n=1 Tax=Osmerus eperlanus TaxID=29151 RepID=UPI002E10157B